MAYTGTGTRDDPYVVDSWESYYTLAADELTGNGKNGDSKYYKFADIDNKIVDFNDIKPEGYTSPLPSKCHVDFNGWTFRNLRMINVVSVFDYLSRNYSQTMKTASFKNGKFENIYVESSSSKFGIASSEAYNNSPANQLTVNNMSFSGTYVYKGTEKSTNLIGYANINRIYIRYIGCSFNFIITTPESTANVNIADNIAVENCSFKIKTQSNAEIRLANNTFKSTIYGKTLNSLIQVEAPNATINANTLSDSNGNLDDRFSTCVIIPTCKELKSTAKCVTTVYNSDNVQTDSTAGSGLIPCTTEQLSSVDYLQSVGFPIGAG